MRPRLRRHRLNIELGSTRPQCSIKCRSPGILTRPATVPSRARYVLHQGPSRRREVTEVDCLANFSEISMVYDAGLECSVTNDSGDLPDIDFDMTLSYLL